MIFFQAKNKVKIYVGIFNTNLFRFFIYFLIGSVKNCFVNGANSAIKYDSMIMLLLIKRPFLFSQSILLQCDTFVEF